MNILFKSDFVDMILNGRKTMTCRAWLRKPPVKGQIIHAQTGYANETRFAELEVFDVIQWSGDINDPIITEEIALKEGFDTISDFIEIFQSLNGKKLDDPKRKYYFVEFKVA